MPLLIEALDPANPPTLEKLDVNECTNRRISNINFDSRAVHATPRTSPDLFVLSSARIQFFRCNGIGTASERKSLAGEKGAFSFMAVANTNGFAFIGGSISKYSRFCSLSTISDFTLQGNTCTELQADGFQIKAATQGVIARNSLTDFWGSDYSLDHVDALQILAPDAELPCRDIVIAQNIFDVTNTDRSQGIFCRAENASRHTNISVIDNAIKAVAYHGITLANV